MPSSLSRGSSPQRRVALPQRRGGQGRRQPRIPGPVDLCPIRPDGQQQPPRRPHGVVRRQPGPQGRGGGAQGLQQLLRGLQAPPPEQPDHRPRQRPVQGPRSCHQHRPAVRRPEAAARVPQGRQLRRPPGDGDPDRQQLPPDPVARRRAEDQGEDGVSRRPADDQGPGVHVGVEHAFHHRDPAPGQKPQAQHTARHGAGDSEEQQQKPQQLLLPAVGHEAQQHPRRELHRRLGQEAQPRQEHRRRVSPPGQRRQGVAPPPQGQARQPGGTEEEQVVHQGVQGEHAVDVDDRHAAPPFFQGIL